MLKNKDFHSLDELCKDFNIELVYKCYSSRTKGFYAEILNKKYIFINENLSDEERLLVIAHEIGHAYIHVTERSYSDKFKCEKEANIFAKELLSCIYENTNNTTDRVINTL